MTMDFSLSPAHAQFRADIRDLIDRHVDRDVRRIAHETGTIHSPALHRALGDAGILRRAKPGAGQDPVELWLLSSEAERAEVPFDATGMVLVIAGLIDAVGSEHLRRQVVEPLLAGRDLVCFGLTEPDGGSDLAATRTRARRDGDEWVVSGAKMWTTMAHEADWVFLLARSDTGGARYDGFTTFVIPMDTPGITVDPVWTVGTERSNATFYDDVRVRDEWVLGEPGNGWAVLGEMLGLERGMSNTGALGPLLDRVVEWAVEGGAIDDPTVRERLARIAIDREVAELLTQRTVWTATQGRPAGTEGSIAKVFATEAYQRHARWAQETAAPHSLLGWGAPSAAAHGGIDHDVRHSLPQTLQGGRARSTGTTSPNGTSVSRGCGERRPRHQARGDAVTDRLDELLEPARTAVLTMELQRGVVGEGALLPELVARVQEAGTVEAAARGCAAARDVGARVVHCTAETRADGAGTAVNCRILAIADKLRREQGAVNEVGSEGAKLMPQLGPDPRDVVVSRLHGMSPFMGTSLDQILRNLGVRTVVVTGVSVNLGVFGMCLGALDLGYQVVLVRDAVAGVPVDYADAVVDHSLAMIATVTDAAEVIERWQGRAI
ncbi:MAG: isochorismatase family protein [Acidimicrobiales bacterium]